MKYYQLLNSETLEVFVSQDLDKQPENSIPFFENSFLKCGFDQYPNPKSIIESATPEEIQNTLVSEETQKYIQRTTDGISAYAKISAEFRLAKLSGQIDNATHSYIENLLIPVRNEVLAGQWKSGKQKLIQIGENAIVADLYNRLFDQLTNYINENY